MCIRDSADTVNGYPARSFWFNAWNNSQCALAGPGHSAVDKANLGIPITAPCSAANTGSLTYVPLPISNAPAALPTFVFVEPRAGATYTVNANNVLRFSAGRFTQPPNASYEQYNVLQQNLAPLIGRFAPFGYNTPNHPLSASSSWNVDASWEHRFAGSDVSLKVTPFYRVTTREI